MKWSPQQAQALDSINAWYRCGDTSQPFILAGHAGTGKTTLAKHIAETIGGFVPFVTFTGKAAHVLRKKGCTTAETIHRLIYQPKSKSRKTLKDLENDLVIALTNDDTQSVLMIQKEIDLEKERLDQPSFQLLEESRAQEADVIIVDEYSMIDEKLGADLVGFGRPIIALGDPGQLPPVRGRSYFRQRPSFILEEVHRQAKDNPIIHLSTLARRGEHIPFGEYGLSRVVPWGSIEESDVLAHDQILVGRNDTRVSSNARVREIKGHSASPTPKAGERVVCCRNNHQINLMNGSTWEVMGVSEVSAADRIGLTLHDPDFLEDGKTWIEAYTAPFKGVKLPFWEKDAEIFDFGYALTVHKSQGSEWSSVMVFDESAFFRRDANKHLYTAITRASERVTLVK